MAGAPAAGDTGRDARGGRPRALGRRDFLRWSGLSTAGLLLVPGVAVPVQAAAATAAAGGGPLVVEVPSAMSKVLRDDAIAATQSPGLALQAAGNEYDSAQVVLRAAQGTLDVEVALDPLRGPGGVLPPPAVSLFQQYYIQVTAPETVRYPAGWYPDALVPIGQLATFQVSSDANQGLWIKVSVPKGQPAGTYQGDLVLTAGGDVRRVPLTLEVWDFELSDQTHMGTSYNLWYDQVATAHGVTPGTQAYRELMDRYYWFQVEHRICSAELPTTWTGDVDSGNPNIDPQTYVELAEPYLSDPRVTNFRIPFYGTDAAGLEQTAQLVSLLRQRGWLGKGYFKVTDEPPLSQYPLLAEIASDLRQIAPEVPNMTTATPVTAIAGDADVWCVPLSHYGAVMVDWVRSVGDAAWWYNDVGIDYPLPSVFIDDSLLGTRLISWMGHDFGIQGQLYWSTTVFQKWNGSAYVPRDDWSDPTAYPNTNGDGFLMYPGVQVGIDGPVATMRLEAIGQGLQDNEYLCLLDQAVERTAARLGVQGVVTPADVERPLFDRLYAAIDDYYPDPAGLSAVRAEVAGMITQMARGNPWLVVFGDSTAGHVVATVYAEPGSSVFVDGRPVPAGGRVGGAEVHESVLDLPAGPRSLQFRLESQGQVETSTRSLLVAPAAPQLGATLLNGFETEADLSRMSLRSVTAALSTEHVTGGDSSVELTFGITYSWPGLTFDAATDLGITDWSPYRYLAFDLYNPNGGVPLNLYIKFTPQTGAADDKHPIWLPVNAATTAMIDLDTITFDRSRMASVNLYLFEETAPVTVYMDTLRLLAVSG